VGLLVAATNIGKTTLSLNLALQLAAGGEFLPIANAHERGLKVLYIDGETREGRLQRDIYVMQRYFNGGEKELLRKNLHIGCDAELDGFPLNLSDETHMRIVKREACKLKPDLIIVDTLSALVDLQAENDNAEVSKRVMKPLAGLAKETGAAILLLHHIGKQSEDAQAGIKAYRGRGASALGAAARYVLVLTPHANSPGRVVLTCAKTKGISFPDTVMKLDANLRWLTKTGEDAPRTASSYERVIETVKKFNREVSRGNIEKAVKSISPSQIGKHLKTAVEIGDLNNPRYGFYCSPEVAHLPTAIDDDQVSNSATNNDDLPF
jgi:RecA-family ATPase